MDALISGILLLIFVLGIGPAARGVSAAIDSVEDPSRPETEAEHDQAHADMVRLLVLLAAVFGVMFVWRAGGA